MNLEKSSLQVYHCTSTAERIRQRKENLKSKLQKKLLAFLSSKCTLVWSTRYSNDSKFYPKTGFSFQKNDPILRITKIYHHD